MMYGRPAFLGTVQAGLSTAGFVAALTFTGAHILNWVHRQIDSAPERCIASHLSIE